MTYKGGCHYSNIRFEVEGEMKGAMDSNCSICQSKDSLMWFVPWERLQLLSASEDAATYTFNEHVIKHRLGKNGVSNLAGLNPQITVSETASEVFPVKRISDTVPGGLDYY